METKTEKSSNKQRITVFILVFILLFGSLYYLLTQNQSLEDTLKERGEEIQSLENEIVQLNAEIITLTSNAKISEEEVLNRQTNIKDCVEIRRPIIRDIAVSIVSKPPSGIYSDNETWKIWEINYWVAHNINYVSDPKGQDYFALASETMLIHAGDCEDQAVLLASMYEAVGLDACLGLVTTVETKRINHMACLVYYSKDSKSFLNEEKIIMDKLSLRSPTGEFGVAYFPAVTIEKLQKYNSGIWIIIDPLSGLVRDIPGYITEDMTYSAVDIIDVGH